MNTKKTFMTQSRSITFSAVLLLILITGVSSSAQAVEGGRSLYLLGKRGPLAGLIPQPGWYLTNDFFHYSGSTDQELPIAGIQSHNISAEAMANLFQGTWITDTTLGDARLAMSLLLPYSHMSTDAFAGTTYAGAPIELQVSDGVSNFGDPVLATSLGWRSSKDDRLRAWNIYASLFIPVGDYEEGRLANNGANRWGLDIGTAFSGGNKKRGREFSGVLGLTINGENLDTKYQSGIEAHLELTYKQHVPGGFSAGLVGYGNLQLTPDSGGPDILGDFKGHVVGFGPELAYQFKIMEHTTSADLRWYHEFWARNRVEGDAVFLTISFAL